MKSNETSVRVLHDDETSFTDEAQSIQSSALAGQGRVVKLDHIVFFSAETGDAWMLDPEDGCAVRLAREFEMRPIPIQETADKLTVEWNADYRIEGEAFTVAERDGSLRTILGYPTADIDPPDIACVHCANAATRICIQCVCNGRGAFCDACAKAHKCGEEILLPVINSPRMGVCAYCGPSREP